MLGIVSVITLTKVYAASYSETLVHEKIPNTWYTRRGGGQAYMSAQYETYTMNGKVVYCIQPGVSITTEDYIGADGLINSPYDAATSKKIELIGYYGYEYIPDNHTTVKYLMATQALIWENIADCKVEFYTKKDRQGDYIDISKERNEIMKLVNDYNNKPNYNEYISTHINAMEIQKFNFEELLSILVESLIASCLIYIFCLSLANYIWSPTIS